jgi:hypothetical protein
MPAGARFSFGRKSTDMVVNGPPLKRPSTCATLAVPAGRSTFGPGARGSDRFENSAR